MKMAVEKHKGKLQLKERKLLSNAFKNVIFERRNAWRSLVLIENRNRGKYYEIGIIRDYKEKIE